MADTQVIPRAKPGDPITAVMWNQLVDRINKSRLMFGPGSGLETQETPFGVMVRVAGSEDNLTLAKTSSSITARSGTAAGSGTVTPQSFDGTDLAAYGSDITAYNFSATSISSGKYCVTCDFGDGYPFVVSVEC